MNDWYQRMVATLQLNGKGERTQQAYTRSVRMLSQFYDKTPDLVSEQELQEYFLQYRADNGQYQPGQGHLPVHNAPTYYSRLPPR